MGKIFLLLRIMGGICIASSALCRLLYEVETRIFIFSEKNANTEKKESIRNIYYKQVILGLLGIILMIIGSAPEILK